MPKTEKASIHEVEITMTLRIGIGAGISLSDAIKELSENLPTCDLISRNGCITGGKVKTYSAKKIK